MNIKSTLKKVAIGLSIGLFIVSCNTDDINPSLTLSSDSTTLSEDNGIVILSASLNANATQQIVIPLVITGTATQSNDYSVSATEITINAGNDSGSVTFSGLQDDSVEGVETLIVNVSGVQNVLILSNTEITISILDDDADTDGDGVLDANDECPELPGDIENNGCPFLGFLINEVLYDPPSGDAGDANADGTRDPNEDEFIEFFNSGPEIDLSGYTLSDESSLRHTFPSNSIIPVNGVLVLFGGGVPSGDFGGAIVQVASEGQINMSNAGDIVTLRDPSGVVILEFDIYPLSGNPDESYTRNPDLTGEFVQHATIPEGDGRLFSPGTKLDGSSF